MDRVRLAIPNGHLMNETLAIMNRSGFQVTGEQRTYRPSINDHHIEVRILRPQEIPLYVENGTQDVGITGVDWIRESKANVLTLLDLEYSKVQVVVAIPQSFSDIHNLSDLVRKFAEEKRPLRISTEYLNLAVETLMANTVYQEYYDKKEPLVVTPWWKHGGNEDVVISLSFGATEAKPPLDADAIVEVVDTGTSLQQNSLKIVEHVLDTYAVLICNRECLNNPMKREKIADIVTLMKGVIDGKKKLHIFLNVRNENLEKLLNTVSALQSPTVTPLSDDGWASVNTIIDRDEYIRLIPMLRKLAQGLVVYEPRQVLPLDGISLGGRQNE